MYELLLNEMSEPRPRDVYVETLSVPTNAISDTGYEPSKTLFPNRAVSVTTCKAFVRT